MKIETIKYSLRNLNHRKGRSFLTIFSILIGIATIFIFISFGWGLYNYIDSFATGSSADKLLIMAKGAGMPGMDDTVKLTEDDLKVIERTGGVFEATGVYYSTAKVEFRGEAKYTFVSSYDPNIPILLDIFGIGIESGRDLKKGDRDGVFGYNYMIDGKIFSKGLQINDVVEINGNKVKVLGFVQTIGNAADDANIYITNERFLNIFPDKKTYAQIIAKVEIDNMEKTIDNLERNLRKSRGIEKGKEDFYIQSFEEMIESYSGALDVIIGFVILIALISVVVSAVNTANTMITSVLERYKEIGILKAIGARNSEILSIFLFESAFLGFVAGCLGVLLGWGISSIAGSILTSVGYGFLQPYFSFTLFAGLILFATITGAISGVFPAIRASRINTVDALRYE